MTNRDMINKLSNAQLSKLFLRFGGCRVCILKKECFREAKDITCAERFEAWLNSEYIGKEHTAK